jgi:hypothetical protein
LNPDARINHLKVKSIYEAIKSTGLLWWEQQTASRGNNLKQRAWAGSTEAKKVGI